MTCSTSERGSRGASITALYDVGEHVLEEDVIVSVERDLGKIFVSLLGFVFLVFVSLEYCEDGRCGSFPTD